MTHPTNDPRVTMDNHQPVSPIPEASATPQWAVDAARHILSGKDFAIDGEYVSAIIAKHSPESALRAEVLDHERWFKEMIADYRLSADDHKVSWRMAINGLIHSLRARLEAAEAHIALTHDASAKIVTACLERDAATERADALRRECEQAREKQKELNRRCQHAESIIAKSGIVEGREQGPKNRSFGRALANYAAAQAYRERDEARAELAQWRDCAGKLAEQLEWTEAVYAETPTGTSNPEFEGSPVSKARVRSMQMALTAYRAIAGEGAGK